MPTFEIIYEAEHEYWFKLEINETMRVGFDAGLLDGIWRWTYFCFNEGRLINDFKIEDGIFSPVYLDESLSKDMTEKINNAFYELIRQVKNHPNYRLKIMNILDDEIRKVWDTI